MKYRCLKTTLSFAVGLAFGAVWTMYDKPHPLDPPTCPRVGGQKFLLVGIVTSSVTIATRADIIQKTWANSEEIDVMYFLGENETGQIERLPRVVHLRGVVNEYPPYHKVRMHKIH